MNKATRFSKGWTGLDAGEGGLLEGAVEQTLEG